MDKENPFASPGIGRFPMAPDVDESQRSAKWQAHLLRSAGYSIIGGIGYALLGSVGFLFVTILLDICCTPPLDAVGNYGQFGMWFLGVTPMLAMIGLTFGLLPLIQWKHYTVGYCLVLVVLAVLGFHGTLLH